jgi:hypothetical protein
MYARSLSVSLDSLFLFSGVAGEAVLLALVLHRRIWRELPVFSGYIVWNFVSDIAGWWTMTTLPTDYASLYLVELFIDSVLQLLVVIELACSVLRPILADRGRINFLMLGGLIALTGSLIWAMAGMLPHPNYSTLAQRLFHLQETMSVLRVLCFLGLTVFSQMLAIGWKDRPLQVAAGLGFFSLVSLVVTALHFQARWQNSSYPWLDRAVSLSYLCVLLYWIVSFSKSPKPKISSV